MLRESSTLLSLSRFTALIFMFVSAAAMSTSSSASSSATKRGALIFLHGLGDTPSGWSHLKFILPQLKPRLQGIKFVFPAAPTIPLSINGGMQMSGWFDLYDWPIGVGCQDDPQGLKRGVNQIEKEIAKLKAEGIPPSKIVVGGFSQGGAVGLLAAYQNKGEPYAGCVSLSGWLTLPDELQIAEGVAKGTPLYWGHGKFDDKVLFSQQKFGVDKLRAAGVSDIKDEAFAMGHESHPTEMENMADFVDRMIFGADGEGARDL